jgi:hypothetical protein
MEGRPLPRSRDAPDSNSTCCPLPKPEVPEHRINNVNAYHGRLKEWGWRFHGGSRGNGT